MLDPWSRYSMACAQHHNNSEVKKEKEKVSSNQSTILPFPLCARITNSITSALMHTNQENLSMSDLSKNFWQQIEVMQKTTDSIAYGERLRRAEETLLKLEKNSQPSQQEELVKMKNQLQIAFQNTPVGPGVLTQRDIDHIQRIASVSHGAICENQYGTKFKKPEMSILTVTNHFTELGFTTVMHSRTVEIEGLPGMRQKSEMCDIFMLGKKFEVGRFWGDNLETLLEKAKEVVKDYLKKGELYVKLGYHGFIVKFIKDLDDKDKAKRLIDQGFQLRVVLIYPTDFNQ